jgi:hypothetical protein
MRQRIPIEGAWQFRDLGGERRPEQNAWSTAQKWKITSLAKTNWLFFVPAL